MDKQTIHRYAATVVQSHIDLAHNIVECFTKRVQLLSRRKKVLIDQNKALTLLRTTNYSK